MAKFDIGDLVVLKSGSMRMCVEGAEGDAISCVWCNEGLIGRDTFDERLLNKWEVREDGGAPRKPYTPRGDRDGDERPRKPYGDREGGSAPRKPYAGDRDGGSAPRKPYAPRADRETGGGDDRPPRKTGWDGKPREKKFYRKED